MVGHRAHAQEPGPTLRRQRQQRQQIAHFGAFEQRAKIEHGDALALQFAGDRLGLAMGAAEDDLLAVGAARRVALGNGGGDAPRFGPLVTGLGQPDMARAGAVGRAGCQSAGGALGRGIAPPTARNSPTSCPSER